MKKISFLGKFYVVVKILLKVGIGAILILCGLALILFTVKLMEQGGTALLFIPAIPLIVAGSILILKGTKLEGDAIVKEQKLDAATISEITGVNINPKDTKGGMLERNNQFAATWAKTNDTRDKLKMVQIAANEEANPQ